MKNKRNRIIVIISVICLISIIVGVTYAFWTYRETQKTINKVNTNCLELELTDVTEAINLISTYPLTDEEAEKLSPYTFKIQNVCNTDVTYDINLEIMDVEERLSSEYIAVEFDGGTKKLLSNYPSVEPTYKKEDYTAIEGRNIGKGTLKNGEEISYTIKLWMDESTPAIEETMNRNFISKIVIQGVQNNLVDLYSEEILNGADPVLADNLIPVVIADDGTVTKANVETEWYNYEDKVWANAVILEDETITYNNYDVIPEENIESYFVWIPRYKYKIWDEGQYTSLTTVDTEKVHSIQIEFETTDVEASTGSTVNSWLTHPAFTSFDVNGLWVGKFESGYKGATSASTAQSNANAPEKLQIKPNVYSWGHIRPANAHLTSYNYKRELDSHMMKNTEWGAVAYLQHSAYGSQTSVRINNNLSLITGYAAVNEPTTGKVGSNTEANKYESTKLGVNGTYTHVYNTEAGYLASTTGNISGIYDMSGGALEYVMGVMADSNGKPMSGLHNVYNSGFVGIYGCPTCDSTLSGIDSSITENTEGEEWPEKKYYDLYTYKDNYTNYTNRILGDATGEVGPFQSKTYASQTRIIGSWYEDESYFLNRNNPFFVRGGSLYMGLGAGVFTFNHESGQNWGTNTFRVVLAP